METSQRSAWLQTVDEHIAHEGAHRLEPLVATFGDHAEWHDTAGGNHMTGATAIHDFYAALFRGFPDFWLETTRKHVADEAVIVEGHLGGTHRGEWMGIPATDKTVRIPFCAVFTFGADNKLTAEIVYYDRLSLLTQLGVIK